MKRALMATCIAILAIVLFLAVSGKKVQTLAGNPAGTSSVRAPIAPDDELEPIIITVPRYRPELESDSDVLLNGRIDLITSKIVLGDSDYAKIAIKDEVDGGAELLRKTPFAGETESGFLGEYRATIKCGKKCRKTASRKR